MDPQELERQIAVLRASPLLLLCKDPSGKERVMSAQECRSTGSRFLHIVEDELDELLTQELGRDE